MLILHGIGTAARALEPGEARFWLSRDRFCALLDRIVAMGPAAPQITFDDGNASDIEIALPELTARGLSAAFFLLSDRLDRPGSLGSGDVTALAEAGQVIGLHGHVHRDWRHLDSETRRQEFRDARSRLADLSGRPITLAAAPFGLYDRRVTTLLAAEGIEALYTSDWGRASGRRFLRPRNCIDATMDDAALSAALEGRVPLYRRPRRLLGLARKRLLPRGQAA
ncbi:polysaccharide deacetylase family protein [Pseudodonghicola xiamenensis]|uniref:polysaccharide deacetylase family protein n=1 Tax=Pseudodonghicola xiamenensis TaxID=337702 RepID=UPI00041257D7|nr:polysaccharide deacetylase family protein [Pseudodonghicola xiamenensis]